MGNESDAVRRRMHERLDQLGLTLDELSESTGHSYRSVCRWLRGEVRMPADFLGGFARAVPVDTEWLLTGRGDPEPSFPARAAEVRNRLAGLLGNQWSQPMTAAAAATAVSRCADGVIAIDRDMRYTLWNPSMERMRGRSAASVLGRRCWKLFPFLKAAGVITRIDPVFSGETVFLLNHPYRVPTNDRPGRLDSLVTPLRNEHGDVTGALAIVHDRTPWFTDRGLVGRRGRTP